MGGKGAVPIIYGETQREIRVLPSLSARQLAELLATGAAAWLCLRMPATSWCRYTAGAAVAAAGTLYATLRWPPGPHGERLAVWLRTAARYALSPRTLAGAAIPGWDGLREIRRGRIRHSSGWSAVLECRGGDPALGGEGAAEAAQAIFRELLHSLPGPLQIVGLVRAVTETDRPAAWDPRPAVDPLASAAQAYAEHWAGLVRTRAASVRHSLVVVTVGGPAAVALPRLDVAVSAVTQCAARLGLGARRITGAELTVLLRAESGALDVRPGPEADDVPLVIRGHA